MNKKLIFLLLFAAACSSPDNGNDLTWLAGEWKGQVSDITYTEEWNQLNKETYNGSSFVIQQGDTVYRDKLKIEIINGVPCYILTMPDTKEPVIFKMTNGKKGDIVFENNEHEFPRLIAYQLNGDSLHVRLEGIREGKKAREEVYYYRSK